MGWVKAARNEKIQKKKTFVWDAFSKFVTTNGTSFCTKSNKFTK